MQIDVVFMKEATCVRLYTIKVLVNASTRALYLPILDYELHLLMA